MPRPARPAPSRLIWAAAISGLALLSLHAELFGREVADVDQRARWAQRSLAVSERRGDSIKVTKAPYRLPGFLYDAAIPAGQETELSDLFPRQVRKLGGLLNHSAFRLKVGEPGERYQLNINWASAAGSHLTIALYDAQSRPRARWSGDHGQGSLTNVDGSVYQLVVSADGPLGDHFRLSAQAQEMPHRETRNSAPTPQFDEIPVLHLTMSPANRVLWESMRRVALSKMNPIGIPVDTPNRRVTATIKADGGVSRARIWLAGQGDPAHMDVRWPSFTVSLQAGALFRGFARFKLYNIVTQNGILDYTVASLLEDEGLFVPRKQLVNVVFNGSNLGLYIIEELAKTQGHFEGHRRYDGQIFSDGQLYADTSGTWARKPPITSGEEFSSAFVDLIAPEAFAKTLALASRFHLTHGLERSELRFYRPILEERLEPYIRDINVGPIEGSFGGYKNLLAHAGWWLRPTVENLAAFVNPKPFPPVPGQPTGLRDYVPSTATLGTSGLHPAILHFLNRPDKRRLFDAYLLYAADEVFQRRFSNRLHQTAEALERYLRHTDAVYWIPGQARNYSGKETIVARAIPAFLSRARLLVQVNSSEPAKASGAEEAAVTLYNLSPFAAEIHLPDFASTRTSGPGENEPLLLAPSHLFLSAIPHFGADATGLVEEEAGSWVPDRQLNRRLLELETLRFSTGAQATDAFTPLMKITFPAERLDEFLGFLRTRSIATLSGTYDLPPAHQVIDRGIGDTAAIGAETEPAAKEQTPAVWGIPPGRLPEPDVLLYLLEVSEAPDGVVFTYVLSNLSSRPVQVDLDRLALNEFGQERVPGRFVSAVWLDAGGRDIEETAPILGAAGPGSGPSGARLSTSWLWPGGLNGILKGARAENLPNSALLRYQVASCGLVQTDAQALARPRQDGRPVQVLVLEPTRAVCPSSVIDPPLGTTQQPLSVLTSSDNAAGLGILRTGRERSSRYKYLSALEQREPAPWRGTVAFDHDSWTFWRPVPQGETGDNWLAVDLGSEQRLRSISLLPGPKLSPSNDIADRRIIVEGSNKSIDGESWTIIVVVPLDEPPPDAGNQDWIQAGVNAKNAYRYYRLRSDNAASLSVREVRLDTGFDHRTDLSVVPIDELIAEGRLVVDRMDDGRTVVRPVERDLRLTEMLQIPQDHIFELPAGSVVRFGPDAGLLSYGAVRALGTNESPVQFLPAIPEAGFKGIAVIGAKIPSLFRYAIMIGARGGFFGPHQISGGLSVYRSSIEISHSRLADLEANDGLHLSHSSFVIQDSLIENTASDAIDIDWSFGLIARTEVSACGHLSGDCIDLSGSRIELDEIVIRQASDKGVSIGEGSVVDARGLSVSDSRIGVAVKDSASVQINKCHIEGNEFGILRYIKKPTYIYPSLRLDGCRFSANVVARLDEPVDIWTRRHD